MKTVAFVVATFVVLAAVVIVHRAAVFYFADPPTLEVTRLTLRHVGTPVVVDSKRSRNPSVVIDALLGSPSHFVVESYLRPGKNDGDQLWVNIYCANERNVTRFQETFYDGEPDGRSGLSIGLEVRTRDADYCSINAIASPRTYIGDASDTRSGLARVALYCPSGCVTGERERG